MSQNFAYKKQNVEKIWVGVKILGGKNPKNGKNLGVGVILDWFGKIYHTFIRFFFRFYEIFKVDLLEQNYEEATPGDLLERYKSGGQ